MVLFYEHFTNAQKELPMTILFQSQWYNSANQPVAMVHSSTKNLSFRHMVRLLKNMGIKNCLFPLTLYDPKLLNIDPHTLNADTDPSGEFRLRVGAECNRNMWYFLREVLRVPVDGSDPISFKLNRGNLAMVWCFMCHIDFSGTQPRQSGKAQPLYSLIKTPSGWTTMGDIKLGDKVSAADGTITNVIGVYPQGLKETYRIYFADDRYTDCCEEHLWKIYNKHKSPEATQWEVIPFSQIREQLAAHTTIESGMYIPLVQPEIKNDVILPNDPYLEGTLLCENEFISPMYLNASTSQKLALLQGFMDTNGTVDQNGCGSISIASELMANQLQQLVQSLGGICKIYTDSTQHAIGNGQNVTNLTYRLAININDPKCLFRSVNKRDLVLTENTSANKLHLGIKHIEYLGKQQTQCIEIAHPDHLYVTDNYVVTHNTIGAISITAWVMYIFGWNMTMGMLTHSADLVQANVKRLKGMKEGLPPYLIHASGNDVDNKEGLDYKALRNSYYTYIGQKDRAAANRVGRGKTGPFLHVDEIGYIPNIKITFPAIMATTNTARVNAKLAGQPHSNIYTTTAADPQTEDGAFAFDLVTQAMPFTEKLYDCVDEVAAHAMVKANSTNGLVNGTFSYLQLGYTHEWFRATIARNNVPPDEVERDYLNHWVSAAKYPIIDKAILARMNASKAEPHHVEVFDTYVISWYVPKEISDSTSFRSKPMVLGMDSSEMIGRDFTTFVGIDPKTLQTLCTFRCNDSNTTKIALFVARFLMEFSHAVFIPERKSTGITIIDTVIMIMLREGHNPFLRIFNQIVDNYDQDEFKKHDIYDTDLSDTTARKYLGFMTSQTTRNFLYKQTLQHAAGIVADKVFDVTLVTEIAGLQAVNGRIDHKSGHHDDMVIAWLLACWLVLEGKNLQYYGLTNTELLPNNITVKNGNADSQQIAFQLQLRKQIKELEIQHRMATNAAVQAHFHYKIAQLSKYLDKSLHIEPTSVENVRTDSAPLQNLTNSEYRKPHLQQHELLELLYF